ncbi:MAG: sigma-70 family RNA polymerase sigma factor [Planctomycetes bacterium]|nr:sigma-70 family RNA polymerase sigma factor [Planctomycetota bacterium]
MKSAAKAYEDVSRQTRRDELILEHLPLVRHTVGRLLAQLPRSVDAENLEAAGMLGLVEAAAKFDPQRGVKFETFATYRIRGAVFDELRRNSPLSQHLLEKVGKVRQAYRELPPPVTVEALAAATGLAAEDVADCLTALRMTRMLSWEDVSDARQPQHRDAAGRPEEAASLEEQKQHLAIGLTELPERQRLVLTLYYLENLRLKEIGQVLGLSESRVSRLLNEALFNLGEFFRMRFDG